jgi:hypothetical protein
MHPGTVLRPLTSPPSRPKFAGPLWKVSPPPSGSGLRGPSHMHTWPPSTMTVQLSTDPVYKKCYVFKNKPVLYYSSCLSLLIVY